MASSLVICFAEFRVDFHLGRSSDLERELQPKLVAFYSGDKAKPSDNKRTNERTNNNTTEKKHKQTNAQTMVDQVKEVLPAGIVISENWSKPPGGNWPSYLIPDGSRNCSDLQTDGKNVGIIALPPVPQSTNKWGNGCSTRSELLVNDFSRSP